MNRRTLLKRLGLVSAGAVIGAKTTKAAEPTPEPITEITEPPTPWFKSVQTKRPSMVMYWYPTAPIGIPISQELLDDSSFGFPVTINLAHPMPSVSRIGQRLCPECNEWTPDDSFCIECGAPLCE